MNLTKADRSFSEYIRRRDAINGYVKCCTCPVVDDWKSMDCGHLEKRGNLSVRWDERNAGVQCPYCNRMNDGEYEKMRVYLINRFGAEAINEVIHLAKQDIKLMQFEIDEIESKYKSKISQL